MSSALSERPVTERALEALRRSGNPFRNYFARNPDDEVCARYHVPELFAGERDLLLSVVDLYRYDPTTHSEVVPILGNKGAGKTHLLHSIKHGTDGAWQLLVTPGVYQKDTEFLEYLLFQIIDTLLGGGRQKGVRPLEFIGEDLVRRLLSKALHDLTTAAKLELFPAVGLGKWARKLGLGTGQANERCQWLIDTLGHRGGLDRPVMSVRRALGEAGLDAQKACDLVDAFVEHSEPHNTAGLMRKAVYQGFARAVLLGDEADLAGFVTYGFAELEFQVRPTRQDLVLSLFKVLMEVFRTLKVPVVVAFDQLEDLLLARRSDDSHRVAEAFFAGIVQVMHQIDGLCFLIFAERGLWNRFVPSLDGYIQDRLNNPVHVPKHGTLKAMRLEAPSPDLVRRVVEARLRPALDELPDAADLPPLYPFQEDQVARVARTEPTLRDMLQQFRHLFDHLVFGSDDKPITPTSKTPPPVLPTPAEPMPDDCLVQAPIAEPTSTREPAGSRLPPDLLRLLGASDESDGETDESIQEVRCDTANPAPSAEVGGEDDELTAPTVNRIEALNPAPVLEPGNRLTQVHDDLTTLVKSVTIVESPPLPPIDLKTSAATPTSPPESPAPAGPSPTHWSESWDQEQRSARRKLEPEGALTAAARELQSGLGAFLQLCHEHGVKVGPWRLQHVVSEWTFGEHPTYGALTIAHWACKDGQPWKVGIGLFLGRGAGKPRDLEVKLTAMEAEPAVIDHLILLRPEDDLSLTGKSKTLWQEAEKRGRHARLEAVSLDTFATIYAFPRWLAAVAESLPDGQPLPNLADLIQEKAEKLLEQVCMPIQ